jgi:hypothetical protein
MSERLRKTDRSVSGNSILVSRSVEMETEIGLPSHLITPACRTVGRNNSSARKLARRMRQNLLDAHVQRMSLIVTKLMKTGMISGCGRTSPKHGTHTHNYRQDRCEFGRGLPRSDPVRDEIKTEDGLQAVEEARLTSCRLSSLPSKPSIWPTASFWLPASVSSTWPSQPL